MHQSVDGYVYDLSFATPSELAAVKLVIRRFDPVVAMLLSAKSSR